MTDTSTLAESPIVTIERDINGALTFANDFMPGLLGLLGDVYPPAKSFGAFLPEITAAIKDAEKVVTDIQSV